MLLGYEPIRSFFEKAYENGSLSHAYCLVGPGGVGKRTLAYEVAALLLKTHPERLVVNPNFYEMKRREDEKTGKLKKEIAVKDVRDLKNRLSGGRWGGEYQVAVIDEAEFLNEEASNALLKVLEEPPAGSIFFLLATNEQVLTPTILSRVQRIYMQPLSDAKLRVALAQEGFKQEEIESVLQFSSGRPGVAIRLLREPEILEVAENEWRRFKELVAQPFYKKVALVEDLFGESEDHIRGREKLINVLELWILWLKKQLEAEPQSLLASGFTAHRIASTIDTIFLTMQELRRNVHPKLLMERLLLQL